jgi:spore germination protein GerM
MIAQVNQINLIICRYPSWQVWKHVVVLGLATTLVACSGVQTPPPPVATSPAPTTASPTTSVSSVPLKVYWIKEDANVVTLLPVTVQVDQKQTSTSDQLQAGLEQLLAGPANSSVSSLIPAQTKLNSLKIAPDGIHVDLSKEFIGGGGSASMQGRLGQIVYTATTLDPKAKVWISVGGNPLQVLGGEGLEVPQPITREQFDQEFRF